MYLGLWFVFLLALAHAVLLVCEYCKFVCELMLPELKVDSRREFVFALVRKLGAFTNLGTTLNDWLWVLGHLVIVSPAAKQHEGWLLAINSLRRSPSLSHIVPSFEYEISFPCSLTEEGVGYF